MLPSRRSPVTFLLAAGAVTVLLGGIAWLGIEHWLEGLGDDAPELLDAAGSLPSGSPDEAAQAEPLGAQAWAERLAQSTGEAPEVWSVDAVVASAEAGIADLEPRLDALAGEIDGSTDWRPLFGRLAADHPKTSAETLALYRREVDRARAFLEEHDLVPLPEGDLKVVEVENRILRSAFPLAVYLDGNHLAGTPLEGSQPTEPTLGVILQAGRDDPGTRDPDAGNPYLANHCRVCVIPLAVHEAYPGHHVAFSALAAHPPPEDPALAREVETHRRNMVFHEGWAQYAELLMLERGYYEGDPEAELAAWRLLLLRAHRAKIDALLHAGRLTPEAAANLYETELHLPPQAAQAELRRHLQNPTLAATYWVGLQQLLDLRREALGEGAAEASDGELRGFHEGVLRWALPLDPTGDRYGK